MSKKSAIWTVFGSAMLGLAISAAAINADEAKASKALKAGDQVAAFNVQDVTGPAAGTSLCYRCRYGGSPVVAVFTRKLDDKVADLVKQIDAQVGENKEKKMKAFVVYLTDDPDKAEPQLKEIAKKHDIKNVPLTIFDGPAGPPEYKIAESADVTVMMWNKSKVKVNEAFENGKLDKKSIAAVVKNTDKILN